MVGAPGFEPGTSRLSGVCSNQLSYAPIAVESAIPTQARHVQKAEEK